MRLVLLELNQSHIHISFLLYVHLLLTNIIANFIHHLTHLRMCKVELGLQVSTILGAELIAFFSILSLN